jgi:acyl-coenzyme A synthetase/AMP-(fatty) acid ligase
MKFGNDAVKKHNLDSLKTLGTVGEPINPEAWLWYYNVIGGGKCPIVDTFWQTETGGHVITPLPGAMPLKPGSACFPFFGVVPAILSEEGKIIEGPGKHIPPNTYHCKAINVFMADPSEFRRGVFGVFETLAKHNANCIWRSPKI